LEKEVEEIRRRKEIAKDGGADNIKRQHDGGKLTVRERIEKLLDAGSFREYGALAGAPKYEGQTLVSLIAGELRWRDGANQRASRRGRRRRLYGARRRGGREYRNKRSYAR